MSRHAFVFGIDNILVDISSLEGLPYGEVVTGSLEAPAIDTVVATATTAKEQGIDVLILTGRAEKYREETEKLLEKYEIEAALVVMQSDDDTDSETEFKRKSLWELRKDYTILNVYADDPEFVAMLKEEGYGYAYVS